MEGYRISTDKALLDLEAIHGYLSRDSYWAAGRQAGFARVITDYATFGWLCDVFILDAHELYSRYGGFTPLAAPGHWMERVREST
jgi:hypothetical protein